jgi:hypothetical protein
VIDGRSLHRITMRESEAEDAQEDHDDPETDAEKDTRIDLSSLDPMRTREEIQEKLWCHLPFQTVEEDLHQNHANETADDGDGVG